MYNVLDSTGHNKGNVVSLTYSGEDGLVRRRLKKKKVRGLIQVDSMPSTSEEHLTKKLISDLYAAVPCRRSRVAVPVELLVSYQKTQCITSPKYNRCPRKSFRRSPLSLLSIMTATQPYNGLHRKLVLAFDVGTTFSGISYRLISYTFVVSK